MFFLRGYCTREICEKLFSFISFNTLIYFGDFFFYLSLSTVGGPTTHIYCSLSNYFILFPASCIHYQRGFSFWLIFVTYVAYTAFKFQLWSCQQYDCQGRSLKTKFISAVLRQSFCWSIQQSFVFASPYVLAVFGSSFGNVLYKLQVKELQN